MRFAWCSLVFLVLGCNNPAPEVNQPNVLFIAIDDLNDWVGTLAGHPQALTPNLDRFASTAMNFKRNYCTSPGCNPSRSTLMTGYHTYTSGMYSNYQDWRKVARMKDAVTLGQYFRNHGYYAAGAGKIYHYSQVAPRTWDDYFPSQENNMPKEYIPDDAPVSMPRFQHMYQMFDWAGLDLADEETADYQSVNYIKDQLAHDHTKPFFLACGIYRPHLPWYVPESYFDLFPLDSIQLPQTAANDTTDLGARALELVRRGGNYHHHVTRAGKWKEAVRAYLASVAFADTMLGHLLDALQESAYADNTIVVVWSDHGWQLGEKQHWRKFALWENVIRTVMMLKVPSGVPGCEQGTLAGSSTESLTSLLDLYPTLVELCGLPPRSALDGRSLVPLITAPQQRWNRAVLTTYDFADYSVRHGDYHYITYVDGSEELYDLKEDPEEWSNLAESDQYDSVCREMRGFLPEDPVVLDESTLIELMPHHIPPVKSHEFYYSSERRQWLQRFDRVWQNE